MKRSMLPIAVTAIVAVGAVTAGGMALAPHRDGETTVVGYFSDASPIEPLSDVRAAGVRVGTVKDIRLAGDKARVTMEVVSSVLPVHRDARLTVKPVNLLGEHYIELDRGTPSTPYLDPAVVPVEQTKSSVTVQDLFNTFDDPTSTALASLVTSLGEGMHGSGADIAAAIESLAPSLRRAEELGKLLSRQNALLGPLVDRVKQVSGSLAAEDGKVLDSLVGGAERTLSAVADEQQALDQTLAELPATVSSARRTMAELRGAADATTPTLKSIQPVTDNLTEITTELEQFTGAAGPALTSLTPVLERADKLLTQARPAVAQLRKAGPDLRGTAKRLRPLGEVLLNQNLADLMAFVKKWSLSTNSRDAISHYFRAKVYVTPQTLKDLASGIPVSGPGPATPPAKSPSVGSVIPDVPLVDGLPAGVIGRAGLGNATGLTPKQELSMVDQLLGGG